MLDVFVIYRITYANSIAVTCFSHIERTGTDEKTVYRRFLVLELLSRTDPPLLSANRHSTALIKHCKLDFWPKGRSRTIYRSLIRNQKVDSLCRFAHVYAGCGRVSSLCNGIVHSDPPSVNLHTSALVLGHLRIFVILKIHKTEAPWSARLQQTFTLYSFRLHIETYVLNRK